MLVCKKPSWQPQEWWDLQEGQTSHGPEDYKPHMSNPAGGRLSKQRSILGEMCRCKHLLCSANCSGAGAEGSLYVPGMHCLIVLHGAFKRCRSCQGWPTFLRQPPTNFLWESKGWSSTWLTTGLIEAILSTRSIWPSPKLATPICLTFPSRTSSSIACLQQSVHAKISASSNCLVGVVCLVKHNAVSLHATVLEMSGCPRFRERAINHKKA